MSDALYPTFATVYRAQPTGQWAPVAQLPIHVSGGTAYVPLYSDVHPYDRIAADGKAYDVLDVWTNRAGNLRLSVSQRSDSMFERSRS